MVSRNEVEKYSKFGSSGQALLIVLLTMAVAIIVVLSVVSKSITDVAITNTEEDSLRAFSAAEAGVEEALLNVVPGTITSGSTDPVEFETNIDQSTPGSGFNYPEQLLSGDTATVWFVGRNSSGVFSCPDNNSCARTNQIQLCWGNSGVTDYPAAEVTVFYDPTRRSFLHSLNNSIDYSGIKAYTLTVDPNTTRASANGFTTGATPNCTLVSNQGSVTYPRRMQWNNLTTTIHNCVNQSVSGGQNCLIMAKVRLLYNTTIAQSFGVGISGTLPAQGYRITSSGFSDDTRSTQRKVEVFQGYPEPPSIFDSTLFSLKGLEKN